MLLTQIGFTLLDSTVTGRLRGSAANGRRSLTPSFLPRPSVDRLVEMFRGLLRGYLPYSLTQNNPSQVQGNRGGCLVMP